MIINDIQKILLIVVFIFVSATGIYFARPTAITWMLNKVVNRALYTWQRTSPDTQEFWERFDLLKLKIELTLYGLIGCLLAFIINFLGRSKILEEYKSISTLRKISFYYTLASSLALIILMWIDTSISLEKYGGVYIRLGFIFFKGIHF